MLHRPTAAFGSAQKFADIFSLYFARFIALTTRSDKTLIREPVSRERRIASEISVSFYVKRSL